jgi:GAF domain-containing protein
VHSGPPDPPTAGPHPGAEDALQHAVDLRNRRLAHAGVARAEEVLMKRYGLTSRQEAFGLMRQASQRFNIKMQTLADVAVRLPAPSGNAPRRPAATAHGNPPQLSSLLSADGTPPTTHGAVLKAALHHTLEITGTAMGNVQLVENGMLRIDKHTGLNRHFTDYFAFIETSTTSCAQAAEESRQVTVRDVAASETFDEGSRHAILQAGSQACHSVPLLSPRGAVVGMISSHHEQPLQDLSTAQLAQLHQLGQQVGRWLTWHRNTAVVDALHHLHATATS